MSPALTHNEGHRLSPAKQAGYRNAKKVHSRKGSWDTAIGVPPMLCSHGWNREGHMTEHRECCANPFQCIPKIQNAVFPGQPAPHCHSPTAALGENQLEETAVMTAKQELSLNCPGKELTAPLPIQQHRKQRCKARSQPTAPRPLMAALMPKHTVIKAECMKVEY